MITIFLFFIIIMLPLNSFREFSSFLICWKWETTKIFHKFIYVPYIQQYAYLCLIITPSGNLIFHVIFRTLHFGHHSTQHSPLLGNQTICQKLIIFAHIVTEIFFLFLCIFAYSISSFSHELHIEHENEKKRNHNKQQINLFHFSLILLSYSRHLMTSFVTIYER